MTIKYSEHALERMKERRVSKREVESCIEGGSKRKLEQGRTRFQRVFPNRRKFRGRTIRNKRITIAAVRRGAGWRVITVMVEYF